MILIGSCELHLLRVQWSVRPFSIYSTQNRPPFRPRIDCCARISDEQISWSQNTATSQLCLHVWRHHAKFLAALVRRGMSARLRRAWVMPFGLSRSLSCGVGHVHRQFYAQIVDGGNEMTQSPSRTYLLRCSTYILPYIGIYTLDDRSH